ncbi:MAG TPA: hypothetical protein VHO70_04275 [Chitinispirillaceae bacterium]|nr:hypothetical protein [Chitinispirillaceae bacterium]
MARSTKDVFESHLLMTLSWEIKPDIQTNYSRNCVIITSEGIFYGHDGVMKALDSINKSMPDADFLYTTKQWAGDIAFLEWQAEGDDYYIDDGTETFYIHDGLICAQTIHYTVRSRST